MRHLSWSNLEEPFLPHLRGSRWGTSWGSGEVTNPVTRVMRNSVVAYEMASLCISIIAWILKTCLGMCQELLGPAHVALPPRPLPSWTLAHMTPTLSKPLIQSVNQEARFQPSYEIPKWRCFRVMTPVVTLIQDIQWPKGIKFLQPAAWPYPIHLHYVIFSIFFCNIIKRFVFYSHWSRSKSMLYPTFDFLMIEQSPVPLIFTPKLLAQMDVPANTCLDSDP